MKYLLITLVLASLAFAACSAPEAPTEGEAMKIARDVSEGGGGGGGRYATPLTCSDSDNNLDYYTFGFVAGNDGRASYKEYDYCINNNILREFYCSGTNVHVYSDFTCPEGCANGKCQYPSMLTCAEYDGGNNPQVFSNLTWSNDTSTMVYSDTCLSAWNLTEWYCEDNYPESETYGCLSECEYGACNATG